MSDYKKDSTTVSICAGQSYSFGSNILSQPGIYRDTLATSGCDSISIVNLIVNDTPAIQIQADKYFVMSFTDKNQNNLPRFLSPKYMVDQYIQGQAQQYPNQKYQN